MNIMIDPHKEIKEAIIKILEHLEYLEVRIIRLEQKDGNDK